MIISLIAAMSENHTIGVGNELPWKLPEDLKWFKRQTLGKPVIMGRNTMDSIARRPLPGRRNIFITRSFDGEVEGFDKTSSLDDALLLTAGAEEVMIVGGAQIYRLALPMADKLLITRVHTQIDGDAFFPEWSEEEWALTSAEAHEADERHAYAYTFETWERKKN